MNNFYKLFNNTLYKSCDNDNIREDFVLLALAGGLSGGNKLNISNNTEVNKEMSSKLGINREMVVKSMQKITIAKKIFTSL